MVDAILELGAEIRYPEFPAILTALKRITGVTFKPDQKPIWAANKEFVSGEIHFVVSKTMGGTALIVTRGEDNARKLVVILHEQFPKVTTHVVSLRQMIPQATNA